MEEKNRVIMSKASDTNSNAAYTMRTDEDDKEYPIVNIDELSSAFQRLQTIDGAFIVVETLPPINSVSAIQVACTLGRKRIRKPRVEYYHVEVLPSGNGESGVIEIYSQRLESFEEVSKIFTDFVEQQKVPDVSSWEYSQF